MSLGEPEVVTFESATTNPSCLLYGPFDARFEDRSVPEIKDPHGVIVRVAYTGVCGSDIHFWVHGGITYKVAEDNPVTLGHEASGTVVAIGEGVKNLRLGDRVAIEPGTPCRRCKECKAGSYHFCDSMKFAAAPGPGEAVHGTLTRYFKLPEDYCYKLAPHISLAEGVLAEPLAVAVHAVQLANVTFGQTVVVLGAGPVGALCVAVAQEFGARVVVSVDVSEERLSFVRDFRDETLTYSSDPLLDAVENAKNIVQVADRDDRGVDTVLEVSGVEASIQAGIHTLRRGGTFVQVGLGKPMVMFPVVAMGEKELHVRGCYRYGAGDFDIALDLINKNKVRVKRLLSRVFPFEEAREAWELARTGKIMKVLIDGA